LASRTYRPRTAHDETPLRRRASGLALALAVNLLLLLVLLGIGGYLPKPQKPSRALFVDLLPESHDSSPAKAVVKPRAVTRPVPPKPPKTPPLKSPIPAKIPLPMIEMSKDEMAAADIRNLPKADSGSAGDSEEVGRGPHGEILYNAEWAREPTDAELAGYLPKGAPEGSGLIACKTIPENRVDDCVELGNDPPGSHLARAVRLAAWQFRVRPPRKNGRAMIGEWVRIRIDYYHIGGD
jgi:protein TonB